MSSTISIGLIIKQKFESGDTTPHHTAIKDGFCYTLVSCVGNAHGNLEYDEPIGEMNYTFWKEFLNSSDGMKRLGKFITQNNTQIIYLNQKEIKEILSHIKLDIEQSGNYAMKREYRERAKWLVFWAEEADRRYGTVAGIGLF